ncbi:MAG TPA: AMP-binding protein, partial [Candidatus Kapabacteria bacterium]|nr:AMP-binding protein [Candidatus Kapabacteria bacterium]
MSEKQTATNHIESLLSEKRLFKPSKKFAESAKIGSIAAYDKLYKQSLKDPQAFFAKQAEELTWFKKWRKVLEWKAPFAKWFIGGKINASYNCLDRHLDSWRRTKAAIIFEGEYGDERTLTYQQLHHEVCKASNMLESLGVRAGDRVAIYMGMTPELAIAVLACARIGATHSVIFGGFSSEAIRDRVNDAEAKVIITADGTFRRGAVVELKKNVDNALRTNDSLGQTGCPTIENVIVLKRTGIEVEMVEGRDHWWTDLMKDASSK